MTNFLKSTLSSLVQSALGSGQGNRRSNSSYRPARQLDDADDDGFINRKVEVGDCKLFVKKKIGDGGFSSVYLATKVSDNTSVAVKRILADDEEQRERVLKESRLWNLCNGPYIVKFLSCARLSNINQLSSEYILLCEYCDHGRLSDFTAAGRKLEAYQAFQVLSHQAAAVAHLHGLPVPVVHRDVKLENFLLRTERNRVVLKLCDFGSATDEQLQPNREWTALYRGLVEDEYATATTPAYRPPELLNTYDEGLIGCPMDMWALGCCFYQEALGLPHPFLDCSKLKIINADYKIPDCDTNVREVIQALLTADPASRMKAFQLKCYISKDPIFIQADDVNLRFLLTPPHPATKPQHAFQLTSRLALLTAVTPPARQADCFVVENIPLNLKWLKYRLPQIVETALTGSAQSVLLYSHIFGRTVVAAASLFSYYGLCRHADHFLHFLSVVISKQSTLQVELPATASRYLDYMFEHPVNRNTMYVKQLEILPGNEPFSTALFQVDDVTGNESIISQTAASCEWQRRVACSVYGDLLIRVSAASREAEVRFNTRYIPLTEAEIVFEGSDFDYQPFGENWIESLTVEFMFTPEDHNDKACNRSSHSNPFLIVKDERELRTVTQALDQASFERSKFFSPPAESRPVAPGPDTTFFGEEASQEQMEATLPERRSDPVITPPDQLLDEVPTSKDASPLIDLGESGKANPGQASAEIPRTLFPEFWESDTAENSGLHDASLFDDLIGSTGGAANNVNVKSEINAKTEKNEKSSNTSRPTRPGPRPPPVDPLQDIFGAQPHTKMSMKEMQDLKLRQEENEPKSLRDIKRWANDSNHKICPLLSGLQSILPGNRLWTPVNLSEQSSYDEVKKCYRKAILLVHPDKNHAKSLPASQQEVCRLIFMELSEAWAKYQAEHG